MLVPAAEGLVYCGVLWRVWCTVEGGCVVVEVHLCLLVLCCQAQLQVLWQEVEQKRRECEALRQELETAKRTTALSSVLDVQVTHTLLTGTCGNEASQLELYCLLDSINSLWENN